MKRLFSRRVFAVVALSVAALGLTPACHHRPRDPELMSEFMVKKVTKELSLNANQQKLLNEATDEVAAFAKEMKAQRAERFSFAVEQVNAAEIDKEKILGRLSAFRQKLDARAVVVLDKIAELHKTLTPEQKARIIEELTKMQKRWADD